MPPSKLKLSRRTLIGLGFIYLAGLGWLAEFIIPFSNIDHKARVWAIVLVLAEISFLIGVAIMGKPVYESLKNRLATYVKGRDKNRK